MTLPDLKYVVPIDLPPIKVEEPSYEVKPEDRVTIKVNLDANTAPEVLQMVKWLEDNLHIRNNLGFDAIEITTQYASRFVRFSVYSKVKPRCANDVNNLMSKDGKIELGTHSLLDAQTPPRLVLDSIRTMMRNHLLHELDECLVVDGKLPYDPHRVIR